MQLAFLKERQKWSLLEEEEELGCVECSKEFTHAERTASSRYRRCHLFPSRSLSVRDRSVSVRAVIHVYCLRSR